MKRKKRAKVVVPTGTREAGMLLWITAIVVAAMGVFWLPWRIPSTTPVVGESYAFGFNNRIGILALGLSIFLGVAGCWFGARRRSSYRWLQASPRLLPPWKEARFEYSLVMGFSILMGILILLWSSYLVDPAWCEARGFIYGIDLLAVGQVPYRDFMYNYGPATIYLPFWLSRASGGLLSFEQAYAAILVLFTVGGFGALFVFLRSLELPQRARPLILGLGLVIWTCESMGLQYTPLRFLIVPVSLVFLHAVASRQSAGNWKALIWIGSAAASAGAFCLATSPEMGIAATVAIAAYGFILMLRRTIADAIACLLGAVAVFAATLLAFPGYLDSVLAFSSGGANFPIYPNLHNLCMVAISLIVLPPLIASALGNPGEGRAPLALALAVGGGMLLPAAFGRCDPGHVAINGMALICLMFPAAAAAGKTPFRIWMAVYTILWVALLQYSYWTQYVPNFTSAMNMHEVYRTHPDIVASWKAKWDALRLSSPHGKDLNWSKTLPFPDGLQELTSKGNVLLASGNEGNLFLARFLLLQNSPPREYFHAYGQGASTSAQVDKKIQQDRAYQYVFVPQSACALVGHSVDLAAYQQGEDALLTTLLFFPVTTEAKNQPYLPDTEYVTKMLNYYKVLGQYNSYVILEQKSTPPPATP